MKQTGLFALSALTLAISQTVLAEEDVQILDDMIVSASRIEQSAKEAPANVTVVNGKKLENGINFVIGDALTAKVPSLHLRGGAIDGGRAGTTMQLSFRGMGINRNLLLVDGQSLTDAYAGQMNWSSISMNDVERIEVIPGVGSALYGSSALGGVISVITKKPTKQEFTAKITQGFDDARRTKLETGYRDKFDNGFSIVANVSIDDRDGYAADLVTLPNPAGTPLSGAKVATGLQPTTTPQGAATNIIGDKGFNASRGINANIKLFYDFNNTTHLNAGIAFTDDENLQKPYHLYLIDSATGQPLALPTSNTTATNLSINGKKSSLKESAFFGSNPGGRTSVRYFAGLDSVIFDDYKLKLKIGKIDQNGWSVGAASTTTNTLTTGLGTLSDAPNSKYEASAELSFGIGERQFIVTGFAFEQNQLFSKKYALSNWTNPDTKTGVTSSVNGTSSLSSIFFQDQIAVIDGLTVYAGGRYDYWQSQGQSRDFKTPANNTDSPERAESSFNPKLSAVYKVTDKLSLKSSIGTGFRAPNNYELYNNPTFSGAASPNGKLILANPNLKPETTRSWEISADMDIWHGGNVKVAYYDTIMKNMIYQKVTKVPTYTLAGTTNVIDYWGQQDNVAGSRIHGVELSAELPVSKWLSFNASYTYTGAKITSDGGLNTGMVGKRLSNVPKNMASLGLEVKKGAWNGMVSSRYTGEVWGSADNLNTDVVKDVWTGYSKYWLTDLKVGYQINKQFKANFAISNLTDEKYFTYYPMPGRSITIDLAAAF